MKKAIIFIISVMLLSSLAAGSVFADEAENTFEGETVTEAVTETETESSTVNAATDYSYLFQRGTDQKRNIPLSDVDHIAILFTSSPLPQSLFLDLEDMKSYYDPGRDIYYNIQVSKYINDLSDSERTEIENIWQKADFENWDFYYEGFSEMDYECHFAIETSEAVYHYEIKGVDAPAPDSLMDFITELLHAFWDPEIIAQ